MPYTVQGMCTFEKGLGSLADGQERPLCPVTGEAPPLHAWVSLHMENDPREAAKWLEANRPVLSCVYDKLCIDNGRPKHVAKAKKSPDSPQEGSSTMTKQKIAKVLDELVEAIVVANGGVVHDCMILCGGKPQASRVAVGGKFDLNAARGILAHSILQHKELLTGATQATPVRATGGPIIGPDGKVHLPGEPAATA